MPARRRLHVTLLLLIVLAGPSAVLLAQESSNPLPEVQEHGPVFLPPLARQARITGQVRLRLTTNGHVVTDVAVLQGHPILAQAAQDNVRTWKFVDHSPGTFEVTFIYRFLEDNTGFLKQPGLVQIVEAPAGGISSYTLPEPWNAHVRNAGSAIDANLTLWTYQSFEPEINGYVTGPRSQEQPIRNPHIDGDMLGFDTTLEDRYGQRLKFSMIGKRSGDTIKGVFLNYWGQAGTWTANRARQTASETSSKLPATGDRTPVVESDVAYHESPAYSYFANEAGIQGTVQLRVTTNGISATSFEVESGNPFLVRDAIKNLRTWRFANHKPRSFDVTYRYLLMNEDVEFLKEPGVVTIEGTAPLVNGSFATFENPPGTWRMELTSPRGNMHAMLSLVDTGDGPDGYVVNESAGPAGKKHEVLRQMHQDGDVLGFDATVTGPNGKPLRISVLGKRTRNTITGVFLDYSGAQGTWRAIRQPSRAKPAR